MARDNEQILAMLNTISTTIKYLKNNNITAINQSMAKSFRDIRTSIENLTEAFYGVKQIDGNHAIDAINNALNKKSDLTEFYSEFDKLSYILNGDIDGLENAPRIIDYHFKRLIMMIQYSTKQALLDDIIKKLNGMKYKTRMNYMKLVEHCSNQSFFWGNLNPDNNDYEAFDKLVTEIKDNINKYTWLYDKLGDYRSKKVLFGLLKFWTTLDFDAKEAISDRSFEPFFDLDLLKDIDEEGVYVDCGSKDGTTAEEYINNFRNYKKMYLYEILPSLSEKAKSRLMGYDNIEFKSEGVGSPTLTKQTVYIRDANEYTAFSLKDPDNSAIIDPNEVKGGVPGGLIPANIVTLDHEISEKITFLKISVEGSELDVIEGCKNHLKLDRPKVAISANKSPGSIWEIAEALLKINGAFKLYLRFSGTHNVYSSSDFVMYAI
ncbi:MAG: FkbM family methyltransferase [Lachnospiraceae bacterium]|nr:FkbM family methyltransferase [Lachnospiraceae bacterium]